MPEKLPIVESKLTIDAIKQKNPNAKIASYLIPAVLFDCGSFNLLVERVTGGVVADIASNKIINLPGLDELSMNEIAILEQGLKLGKFSAEDISIGLNKFRIESALSDLLRKKIVTINNRKYQATERFKIIYAPKEYATKEKIIVKEANGVKIDAKLSVSQIQERIEAITKTNKADECWILYHKQI